MSLFQSAVLCLVSMRPKKAARKTRAKRGKRRAALCLRSLTIEDGEMKMENKIQVINIICKGRTRTEEVLKLSAKVSKLDPRVAAALYVEVKKIIRTEQTLRHEMYVWGMKLSEKIIFEELPENCRRCKKCNEVCFLSAVSCPCSPGDMVCLPHHKELCTCSPGLKSLLYRYTLLELPVVLERLRIKGEVIDKWVNKLRSILDNHPELWKEINWPQQLSLLKDAQRRGYDDSVPLNNLVNDIESSLDELSYVSDECEER